MLKPVHEMTRKPKAPDVSAFGQVAAGEAPKETQRNYVEMPEGKFASYTDGVEGGTVKRLTTPKF